MRAAAADEFATHFGPVLSLFFGDADGIEREVCVASPDAVPAATTHPAFARLATPPRRDATQLTPAQRGAQE